MIRKYGFLKHSLVDYPGEVCSVVFIPGCNFCCPYCHNQTLEVDVLQHGWTTKEIEAYLNDSPLISEALVLGMHKENDDETYVNAQIFPDKEAITEYLKGSVPTKEEIIKIINDVVASVNKKIPNYKHIKNVDIRDKEFEKTTTQKIKRYGNNMKNQNK